MRHHRGDKHFSLLHGYASTSDAGEPARIKKGRLMLTNPWTLWGLLLLAGFGLIAVLLFGRLWGLARSASNTAYNWANGVTTGIPAASPVRNLALVLSAVFGVIAMLIVIYAFSIFVTHSPRAWAQTAVNSLQNTANFLTTFQSSNDEPLVPPPPPPAPAAVSTSPNAARINAAIEYFRIRMVEMPSGRIIPDSGWIFEAGQGETHLEMGEHGEIFLVIPPHSGRIVTISNPVDYPFKWTINVRRADGTSYASVIEPGYHCNEVEYGRVRLK